MTDANEALRALDKIEKMYRHFDGINIFIGIIRAHLTDPGYVQGEPADHYDQAPDWSKAPEGATHWGPGEDGGAYAAWYRKKDGEWECWLYPSDHYWGYSNPLGRILIPRPEPEWIPSNGQEPELPDDTLYARTSDATPQPAEQQPDVAKLVEALEEARLTLEVMQGRGSSVKLTLEIIDRALVAHRKQGDIR